MGSLFSDILWKWLIPDRVEATELADTPLFVRWVMNKQIVSVEIGRLHGRSNSLVKTFSFFQALLYAFLVFGANALENSSDMPDRN